VEKGSTKEDAARSFFKRGERQNSFLLQLYTD
jgi:hypothetical protein